MFIVTTEAAEAYDQYGSGKIRRELMLESATGKIALNIANFSKSINAEKLTCYAGLGQGTQENFPQLARMSVKTDSSLVVLRDASCVVRAMAKPRTQQTSDMRDCGSTVIPPSF